MNKFQTLKGNWIVKKRVTKNISVRGRCVIKSSTKYFFELKEDIKTNIDNNLISGYQIFQISESKTNINFYINTEIVTKKMFTISKKKDFISHFISVKKIYIFLN